jgi:hypothetical protein
LSSNLGSVFFFFIFSVIVIVLIPLLYCFKKNSVLKKLRNKLQEKFLWNFYITLILETNLELCFGGLFNLVYAPIFVADEQGVHHLSGEMTSAEWINVVLAAIFGSAAFLLPIFIGVFYLKNFYRWCDEEF